MQNRTAIWVFTILLAVASLYQLSFSYFTNSFENKAEAFANAEVQALLDDGSIVSDDRQAKFEEFEKKYISDFGNDPLVPITGTTYNSCKDQEIKKGLDLEGGMSVTLEVNIPEFVTKMASKSSTDVFKSVMARAKELQLSSEDGFIDLFEQAWNEKERNVRMAEVFSGRDNKDLFPINASNDEIVEILKVQTAAALSNTEEIIRTRIDRFGVTQPTIQKQQFTDRILVELPGVKDRVRMRELLKSTANLEFWKTYDNSEAFCAGEQGFGQTIVNAESLLAAIYSPELAEEAAADEVDTRSFEVIDGDTIYIDDETEEDVQEVDDADPRKRPLTSLLSLSGQPGAILGSAAVSDTARINGMLSQKVVKDMLPKDNKFKLAWSGKPVNGRLSLYGLKISTKSGEPELDGSYIVDASQDFEQLSKQAMVNMQMNTDGAAIWKRMTREAISVNPNRCIAIVLDGAVQSAPQVQSEIGGGRSQITMGASDGGDVLGEAVDLANLLKAGALPASANIVDEQIVGPTLGAENIRTSLIAFGVAFLVILIYMVFYYGKAGAIADIALIANVFFLFGALASLHASLTLPGIAGIILTIGMAVDANVLIFERIKEEMRAGAGVRAAVTKGYSKAYSAIIDANLTTLITAIVLLLAGSGPIKGFATTLIIGIFTSLFSAIFITRLIISSQLEKGKNVSFFNNMTKNWMSDMNVQFVQKRKIFYVISGLVITAGLVSLFTNKLDFGVDFTGGRTYDIKFEKPIEVDAVKASLKNAFKLEDGSFEEPQVKRLGTTGDGVKITTNFLISDKSPNVDRMVDDALLAGLANTGQKVDMDSFGSKKVAPTISDDFQSSSRNAVLIALAFIFIYIFFRFRKWQFGLGALAALVHDVLVVLGIYSILYKFVPFSMEIDMAFIAAILTVVGYSINDTVVVFDRIREYLQESRKGDSKTIVNRALNSTISRTVNTSLSTFVVLFTIFIFGSESIKGFTFALMVGVVVGTYSSLFIATPLVVDLSGESLKKDMKAAKV